MILVTGATGTIGRPLVETLLAAGAQVRAVSRDPGSARVPGAEVVGGDPSDPTSLAHALMGVHTLVLNPRAVGAAAVDLVSLARAYGVSRIIVLSALNVDFALDRQPSRLRGEFNKEAEAAAAGSGLEWAALRSGSYAERHRQLGRPDPVRRRGPRVFSAGCLGAAPRKGRGRRGRSCRAD